MAVFECPVVRITLEPHPNAAAIEIARVGDFRSIVKKGQFRAGDLAVYLPEGAVLPAWLLQQLGFWNAAGECGTLNGSAKNRIKAIKLRGVLSQGILLGGSQPGAHDDAPCLILTAPTETVDAPHGDFQLGQCAAAFLGVTKYQPAIPAAMAGRVIGANLAITHNYDFENIKKHPDLFDDGEDVVMTEKIHGTLLQICVVPAALADDKFYKGRVVITSKGLGGRGILLDHNDTSNVYARAVHKLGLLDKMATFADTVQITQPIVLFGEVYGTGVQDLGYASELSFRAFDLCEGVREQARFAAHDGFAAWSDLLGITQVPVLYRGPFSKGAMLTHTDGPETLSGHASHMREGIVIKSARRPQRHGTEASALRPQDRQEHQRCLLAAQERHGVQLTWRRRSTNPASHRRATRSASLACARNTTWPCANWAS